MSEMIVVTNWEKVDKDDFYLSKEWEENQGNRTKLRKMAREGELFIAYVVPAIDYCIYGQMDASQIFIDMNNEEVLHCEGVVIDNKHEHKWKYER